MGIQNEIDISLVDIFAVHSEGDDRSRGEPKWFYLCSSQASRVAEGRGYFGSDAYVSKMNAIAIHNRNETKYFLLARKEPINIDYGPDDILAKKQAALAKLTEEDIKLLNIRL